LVVEVEWAQEVALVVAAEEEGVDFSTLEV
jgi:hypothetical protein